MSEHDRGASLEKRIIARLREALGEGRFSLHEPWLGAQEREAVEEALRSTFVSSVGAFVDRFEEEIAARVGVKHAIAVVNGTAGLHAALLACGVRPGDEVIVPAISFIATANAVAHCSATPHFVDVEEETLALDAAKLREHLGKTAEIRGGACFNRHTGARIAAMVPVHVFGHPADMQALEEVAGEFALPIIEDAAEALGSSRHGRAAGSFGLAGVFSFNGNKIITTGGGGMIVTDDDAFAARVRHLTTTAKIPHPWLYEHDEVGYNYRMPNINAAMGVAQLARLDHFLAAKRRLLARYEAVFSGIGEVRLMREPEGASSNYWLQALVLSPAAAERRDALLEALNAAGYGCRPLWGLLPRQRPYRDAPRADLSVALDMERRIINIPSSAFLGEG